MSETRKLTPGQISDVRGVFREQEPVSGVLFELYPNNYLSLQPPIWDSGQSSEGVVSWYEQRYGPIKINANLHPLTGSVSGKASSIREQRGGCGIWARTLQEIENELPTVTQELAQARGQVLFLGNGLSDVPLHLADCFQGGKLDRPPVIVDMFSYPALMQDFIRLDEVLRHLSIPPSSLVNFTEFYTKLNSLVLACEGGFLKAIEYFVGSGQAPPILNNSSLIINCFGPSAKTLSEQLRFLAPGGKLLTTQKEVYVPPEFRLESLRSGATKITRVI